jgi:predicted NBD/HSP70 family sugar kinase
MAKQPVPGNARLLKDLNRFQVLDALRRGGPMARSELARLTGLTAPTVGTIVGSLVAEGVLLEQAAAPGPGLGRRAVPVAINPDGAVAVGINVGITHVRVAVVDLLGQVRARETLTVEAGEAVPSTGRPEASDRVAPAPGRTGPDPAHLAARIAQTAHRLLAAAGAQRVLGAGAGLHGLVAHETGVVRFAPHFGWRDVPFAALLSEALQLPVVADNGVRCMALGELRFGAGRGVPNFVCVAVGTGIGAAIVLDGKLYRGAGGTAGEIGHVTVDVTGPHCQCGSRGCLETLASGPAIARRAGARSAEQVHRAALAGGDGARQTLAEAGEYLGIAAANLAKTLNPELVLIGGGVSGAGEFLLEPLRRSLAARSLDPGSGPLPVRPVALGPEAGVVGAAALVLDRFFQAGAVPAALQLIDR